MNCFVYYMKLVIEMSSIMKAMFINKKVELFNKNKKKTATDRCLL